MLVTATRARLAGHPWVTAVRQGWPLLAAAAAWSGAALATTGAVRFPAAVVLAAGIVSWRVVRRPWSWCLVLLLFVNVMATRAVDGLDDVGDEPFEGAVRLVTDPRPTVGGSLRAEVDTDKGHLLAEIRSPDAVAAIENLHAGERVVVTGTTSPFRRHTAWTRSRHLAGRVRIERLHQAGPGPPYVGAANAFRDNLMRGASSLDENARPLLAGLVFGDDRAQPPELTADFRASGLTHLLAVSGQNVAFVLAVASVVLKRMRLWPRYVLSVGVIAAFAVVTRFEPSVMRASFVAGVALFAHTTGRRSSGVRHMAIAVCILLLVDPLLVESLGFRLSLAASLGVLVLAPPLIERLVGPEWIRQALGVTAGAQLAVAPVLIPSLGPMPLAALPANILAGPIAGLLMVWGLTAGTIAGVMGNRFAWLLHRPTAVGLDLLELVASSGATLPLGLVTLRHVAVLGVAGGLWYAGRRATRLVAVVGAMAVCVSALVTPVRLGAHDAGFDASVWVDGRVAVIDMGPRADPVEVLGTLRSTRVAAVGLVVVRSTKSEMLDAVDAIAARYPVGAVIGPPGLTGGNVVVPPDGFTVRVARLKITVDRAGPPLRARIGWVSGR